MVDDMRVYIANLGKYNEGYLVGDWFSFPIDEEEVAERIGLNSYYEEYAVHDTDNFPIEIGEYVSIEQLNEMYDIICELPDYITDALDEFVSHYGSLEEVYEHKDDVYFYPDCENMTDLAYYFIDEMQMLGEIPPQLQNYIDYEAYGRDLSFEGTFIETSRGSISDYGRPSEERVALTVSQQEKLIAFAKQSNVYNTYYPMLTIMIGTGLRCGELIGLTWKDVDTRARRLNVDHQLIYKNYGDGCRFHISTPKTDSGIRVIPMTQEVQKAFEEQRKINFMLAKDKSVEVDGYSGFVFTAKSGRPLMPYGVNSVLYNIVDAYNKEEVQRAKKEHRKAKLLPKVSAHVMRHTACTRMAECRMDIKVLQYIMGHAHFDVTMEVYNHLGDRARIENEIAKLDSMAVNF